MTWSDVTSAVEGCAMWQRSEEPDRQQLGEEDSKGCCCDAEQSRDSELQSQTRRAVLWTSFFRATAQVPRIDVGRSTCSAPSCLRRRATWESATCWKWELTSKACLRNVPAALESNKSDCAFRIQLFCAPSEADHRSCEITGTTTSVLLAAKGRGGWGQRSKGLTNVLFVCRATWGWYFRVGNGKGNRFKHGVVFGGVPVGQPSQHNDAKADAGQDHAARPLHTSPPISNTTGIRREIKAGDEGMGCNRQAERHPPSVQTAASDRSNGKLDAMPVHLWELYIAVQ
ncbi:hypothetical protein BKA66DRAFT_580825 [Pyrenochaeta sp. MPI-SDFR-AT-0127]|nr:hypothetical protein BKA66DRAFT_580825 [Pyrenochaeta sp. MPI-SDFR-AT-0127]